MLPSEAPDLGLHCLPWSKDARLILVKRTHTILLPLVNVLFSVCLRLIYVII